MESQKRMSVSLTPELLQAIKALKKTDQFCMLPQSEIIRIALTEGFRGLSNEHTSLNVGAQGHKSKA